MPIAVLVLTDVALRNGDPLPGAAALAGYALIVVSPIWFTPERLGVVRALILQNTFTLLLVGLVIAMPCRRASCHLAIDHRI